MSNLFLPYLCNGIKQTFSKLFTLFFSFLFQDSGYWIDYIILQSMLTEYETLLFL